jgi:tetratricopeptide (TPR) repeat protein
MALLVFCMTALAYLPSFTGEIIWNDNDYVTAPALSSFRGLGRIWTEPGATQQYYPLLHSAFWVQHRLWGDHPFGYHVVTLLLHAGSAVLFALVLSRLRISGAWLAALLFALHPVHVESVAWITEQKNTLSLFFYLAAALIYLDFDETRRPRAYGAALVLFLLSLLCKTVTATLPAALLVVFWWKRGRLEWRRDVQPLIAWVILGAATGLFSSWVEKNFVGAQGVDFTLPFLARVLVAARAFFFYLGKLVWPSDLNFVYPRWIVDAADWRQWLFVLGLAGLAATLWAVRGRTRAPLATFLFFAGSLFPVLGFINLYGALYSWVWDHWQYLPDLGPLALAGAGIALGWEKAAVQLRWLGRPSMAALAVLLGALTWNHCKLFHDDQTLFRTTIAHNPCCWMAHNNLGLILADSPATLPEAIAEYTEALRLKPDDPAAHNNLGFALTKIPGRLPEAIAHFEMSLRLLPENPTTQNNLGIALASIPGRLAEAIGHYEAALQVKPDDSAVHNNLGLALAKMPGRLPEAIAHFETALKISPDDSNTHCNLGNALAKLPDRLPEALVHLETAVRLQPNSAETHFALGIVLAKLPGRLPEAIRHYQAALLIRPDDPNVHGNLGCALARTPGGLPEAIAHLETALRLRPDDPEMHDNLGLVLQDIPGRLPEAVAHYEAALRLKPDDPVAHNSLGIVLAQDPGRVEEAVAHFEAALQADSGDPKAHNNLGLALARIPGRLAGAISEYETALWLRPAYPEAHCNLAKALLTIPGRRGEALAHYEEALRIRPDLTAIRQVVEHLRAESR